ncbi:lytic transglycosylase domain-containing protein [Commensalibacter nepenthis]|uniref:Lytic transglycosylase domain-containing protein n=1 Tax=Commensalibacter nepenthis TaxID=3043872 RepID=A0ABT6QAE2_9PROT|nr:lytic transglycosylase domain-containing protein [Commensalibacter sp. TBRC 10068]MDI2113874.1 lytic transglycosylase domain-containing protein [Commensalibacter sp. TBRC 10068]
MVTPVLAACAMYIAPATLDAIITVESNGNPLAIHVNNGNSPIVKDQKEAVRVTKKLIAQGYSVDIGLMQINSKNLPRIGMSVEEVFDPCTNIKAGAMILSANYSNALKITSNQQEALKIALSLYNTGTTYRGFSNGYVGKYYVSVNAKFTRKIKQKRGNKTSNKSFNNPYTAQTSIPIPSEFLEQKT